MSNSPYYKNKKPNPINSNINNVFFMNIFQEEQDITEDSINDITPFKHNRKRTGREKFIILEEKLKHFFFISPTKVNNYLKSEFNCSTDYETALYLCVTIEKVMLFYFQNIMSFPSEVLRMCKKNEQPISNAQRIDITNIELSAR